MPAAKSPAPLTARWNGMVAGDGQFEASVTWKAVMSSVPPMATAGLLPVPSGIVTEGCVDSSDCARGARAGRSRAAPAAGDSGDRARGARPRRACGPCASSACGPCIGSIACPRAGGNSGSIARSARAAPAAGDSAGCACGAPPRRACGPCASSARDSCFGARAGPACGGSSDYARGARCDDGAGSYIRAGPRGLAGLRAHERAGQCCTAQAPGQCARGSQAGRSGPRAGNGPGGADGDIGSGLTRAAGRDAQASDQRRQGLTPRAAREGLFLLDLPTAKNRIASSMDVPGRRVSADDIPPQDVLREGENAWAF